MTQTESIVLLTKSYRGDFEMCRNLCRSIDTLMPEIVHYLIVERCDRKLFSPFENERRKIITTESLLPEFFRVRLPSGRNMWLCPYRLKPVAGWHLQQLTKLALAASLDAKAVIMVDSDVEFVRPIALDEIVKGGRTRLLRYALTRPKPFHSEWAQVGARLLGLSVPASPPEFNYVHTLVYWKPSVVRALLARVQSATGMKWRKALCRQKTFSEYYLYGQFAEYVNGAHQEELFFDERLLCHTLLYDFSHTDSPPEDDFVASLANWQVAFGIQSNIHMQMDRREALAARLRSAAKANL